MEIAGLEETHAAALAEVAKQIQLLVCEEAAIFIVECFQILYEIPLAFVERHRAHLDDVLVQVEQRLVQVPTKPDRLHAVELPRFEVTLLNQRLQLLESSDNLFLGLLDQYAVVAFADL